MAMAAAMVGVFFSISPLKCMSRTLKSTDSYIQNNKQGRQEPSKLGLSQFLWPVPSKMEIEERKIYLEEP